jgi:hypothetical protein
MCCTHRRLTCGTMRCMREKPGYEKYMGRGGTQGHARRGGMTAGCGRHVIGGGRRKAHEPGRRGGGIHARRVEPGRHARRGRDTEGPGDEANEGGRGRHARSIRYLDYIVHVYV